MLQIHSTQSKTVLFLVRKMLIVSKKINTIANLNEVNDDNNKAQGQSVTMAHGQIPCKTV